MRLDVYNLESCPHSFITGLRLVVERAALSRLSTLMQLQKQKIKHCESGGLCRCSLQNPHSVTDDMVSMNHNSGHSIFFLCPQPQNCISTTDGCYSLLVEPMICPCNINTTMDLISSFKTQQKVIIPVTEVLD